MTAPTPAEPLVLVTDDGPVRHVVLNRPSVRNAIDVPLRVALAEALEACAEEASVRAVVLSGAGGAFCSGGDISSMQRQGRAATVPRAQAAQRVVRAIWSMPQPVIAAVEGPAYGAGFALALACDRVVAAADATLAATFSKVGLAGDMGIFASLPARVGPSRAKQLLMLPDPLSGEEALTLGLVDRVATPGQAVEAAYEDAVRLAASAPQALAVVKQMFSGELRHPRTVLDLEVEHQAVLFDSDDFAEGVAAFREKRRPVFGRRTGDAAPPAPAHRTAGGTP